VPVAVGLTRSFKVALLISTLIHLGVFTALSQETITRKIFAPPKVLLAKKAPLPQKSEPKAVRFELVDTPPSATAPTPPDKTNLMSDKNTRAQDKFQRDKKLADSPHMEGRSEEAKDTRPHAALVPPPAPPAQKPRPPTEQPKPQETPKPAPPKKAQERSVERITKEPSPKPHPEAQKGLLASKDKIMVAREWEKNIAPEPKEKEVIQLAKKMPEPAPALPAISTPPPATPNIISVASPKNADADAQITGELSYAASRHFFGEYLLKMKQSVERQWVSQLISKYTGIVSSKAVIDFKIQPDGRVTDIGVNSSEGDPYFPLVCVSSINDAQPFDKIPYSEVPGLPDEFVGKPLNIRFTFQYN
jgi:hypothetical protein